MALFVLAVIVFIIADISIRMISKRLTEKKQKKEREVVLQESLKLDFTSEAKTLKRAEVQNPKAKILCVDDEEVILGSFVGRTRTSKRVMLRRFVNRCLWLRTGPAMNF